jgi:hypothetical protein
MLSGGAGGLPSSPLDQRNQNWIFFKPMQRKVEFCGTFYYDLTVLLKELS